MARYDKVKLAFDFFCIKEKSGQSFTLRELADFTGWKIETCKTYVSKHWHHLLNQSSGGEYSSIGMSSLTSDEFLSLHSQKLATHQNNSEQTELVNKAKDFAMLAVGVYNNPLFKLKTYGYIVNITIAFTISINFVKKRYRCF